MIFRLSQKLNDKIKVGRMEVMPLDDNPLAEWSAQLFAVGRTQYILLANTKALRSTVLVAKGITSGADFVELALGGIRELLEADGHSGVYEQVVVPACTSIFYAKALNRSVTAQAKHIAHVFASSGWNNWSAATIHSQQGAEADFVIFDTVNAGSCAWPDDEWRRLVNVGLSRARQFVLFL